MAFANAYHLCFPPDSFDRVLSGFMGWYDCFDFFRGEFTQEDQKSREIWRVLKTGGRFVCCSWEIQEDIRWMEDAILRHYPEILNDPEYLERRPIGMAYEKPGGYQVILRSAGFHQISVVVEESAFVSTDEEEWWRQMRQVGWASLLDTIDRQGSDRLHEIKRVFFEELQQFKKEGEIHFNKKVIFASGVK